METFIQQQKVKNPFNKGKPLPKTEIDRLRSALSLLLQDEKCSKFVAAVLDQISEDTKRKAFSSNILGIFDEVGKQAGFGTRPMPATAEGASTVGNKDAYINIGPYTFSDNPYALANVGRTMIHELLHVGSTSTQFNYTHYDMFKAAYSVAHRLGGFTFNKQPEAKDPGGKNESDAYAFDDLLFQACRVR